MDYSAKIDTEKTKYFSKTSHDVNKYSVIVYFFIYNTKLTSKILLLQVKNVAGHWSAGQSFT